MGIGLIHFRFNAFTGFQGAFALQMAGIPDFDFVIVDPQIDQIGGLAADDDFIVAGMLELRSKKTAEQ